MCGDGAAIGFLCGNVICRIFHHSPSALGCYHLNRAAIAWGMVVYAAMALSPHFGLFILNCFIVYLPLVVYDVHECFYFHFPLYFKFQARLPDQNFILAAKYCHMLLFFIQMYYCVLGTCVILILHMFPKLRIQWGQKVFIFSVFP